MSGIKFYSLSNLSNGHQLAELKEITDKFSSHKTDYNVNEIIELYNITLFIEAGLFLVSWSKDDINKLIELKPSLNKNIAIFMKSITPKNILSIYDELDYDYIDNFWELFEKFKLYQSIPSESIQAILLNNQGHLRHFLERKVLVDYYGATTRELILSDSQNAELLLDKYVIQRENAQRTMNFPSILSVSDREELIIRYIQQPEANLNFLRIIIDTLGSSGLVLSNKTRLAARRRADSETKKLFEKSEGFKYGAAVCFTTDLDSDFKIELKNRIIECSYNTKWIEENLDFYTLLNNFIHLFGFADMQMRITLVSKQSGLGLFERYLTVRPKNSYPTGIGFDQESALSNLQIAGYTRHLMKYEIELESIIEWFFQSYLYEEFDIKDFHIQIPTSESSYLEKCRTILPEIESILKQYNLYIEDGIIDHELLQMSSDHMFYKDIRTNNQMKYIYPTGDDYTYIAQCFFSDQSGLAYIKKTRRKYQVLFDLLLNENVTLVDFQNYQQSKLKGIIDLGYLMLDENGYIRITDLREAYVLRDLYKNEVVSYWHYPEDHRIAVDSLIKRGLAESESTLFSRPEQAYFNYHLNKAEFCNSLDLRNKYSHGTQPSDETSEQTHEMNYIIFIKLLILIIIKINDDLCLHDEMNTLGNNSI